MIGTFFQATFVVGVPVFLLGYFLISWALKTGRLPAYSDHNGLRKSVKSMQEAHKNKKKKAEANTEKSVLLEKWLKFGGGFYGTTAFYTYIVVELGEVLSFIGRMLDPANWKISLTVDIIINFIINSIMNFVTAIAWVTYWPPAGGHKYIWIWLLVSFVAYTLAAHYARTRPFTSFEQLFDIFSQKEAAPDIETGPSVQESGPAEEAQERKT